VRSEFAVVAACNRWHRSGARKMRHRRLSDHAQISKPCEHPLVKWLIDIIESL
jgi:hypothetical protein